MLSKHPKTLESNYRMHSSYSLAAKEASTMLSTTMEIKSKEALALNSNAAMEETKPTQN